MKKIVLILSILFVPLLGQQPQMQEPDQFQMYSAASGASMHRMMERCRSEGYKYFLISKLTYKDGRGQRGEYVGIQPDRRGAILKDTMSDDEAKAFGKVTVAIEVVAFKDDPQNPLAADVDAYFRMVQAFQEGAQR